MQAYFFGNSGSALFGVYHPPGPKRFQDRAVLLCYSIGREYMKAHWAFRRLSKMLSDEGFHVFRFDYFGTGDSAGESSEGSVLRWKADVVCAFQELMDISRAKEASIVGFRLGAALSNEVCAEGFHVKNLVLWDPVVIGKNYMEELKALHQKRPSKYGEIPAGQDFKELLGYQLPPGFQGEIEKIDLLSTARFSAEKTSLIVSNEKSEFSALRDRLAALNVDFTFHLVEETGDSGDVERVDDVMLVNDILLKIREVIGEKQL